MKVIAKYYGGSHSYGLANESSDLDERYLFLNTDVSKIIGLERYEHQCRQTDEEDSFGWELRHFLNLLRKGNTSALELLWNNKWVERSNEFDLLQDNKNKLIDSDRLFSCLCGYCHSERNFVLGNRTGKLGGKRYSALEKYGYSYKNAVQYLRLCYTGAQFFKDGVFPVDMSESIFYEQLASIKNEPQDYTKEDIIKLMDGALKYLHGSYNDAKYKYEYDVDLANQICLDLYLPVLTNYNYPLW